MTQKDSLSRFKRRLISQSKEETIAEQIELHDLDSVDAKRVEELLKNFSLLEEILKFEIEHLERGDHHTAISRLEEKQEVVTLLEIQVPAVAHVFENDDELSAKMKDNFKTINELQEKAAHLIERASEATKTISAEVQRIIKRHSLGGLYDQRGKQSRKNNFIKSKFSGEL